MNVNIERKDVIFIIVMISFLVGAIVFFKNKSSSTDPLRRYDKTPVSQNTNGIDTRPRFTQNFEATLNSLLKDVYDQMNAYRARRKILDGIMRPDSLQNAQYITENYQLAQKTIPDLQNRSVYIVSIFDQKDAEIKKLIKSRPPESQKTILTAWNKMKNEQINLYVKYFTIEQEILDWYQELITLYYQNKEQVIYLKEANTVSFATPPLNQQANQITSKIQSLKTQQNALQ